MPFDPNKPANSTNASSAEMRAQLAALHADIQLRALEGSLTGAISGTALNPTSVPTFAEQGVSFGDAEKQQLASKIDELINALRRF